MKSIIMVAVAALSCVAFAEGAPEGGARPEGGRRGFGHREGMGPMMGVMDPIVRIVANPAIAEKIGLSDAQKAKLNELKRCPRALASRRRRCMRRWRSRSSS